MCECVGDKGFEGEQEVEQEEVKRLEEKRGEELIFRPLMMVIWDQIRGTPDLFAALGQLELCFSVHLKTQ